MRKFLISIALSSTVMAAAPAMAQYGGAYQQHADQRGDRRGDFGRHDWNRDGPSRQAINDLLRDLNRAEGMIQRSVQNGRVSQREAFGLRREANQVSARLDRASRGGISQREFESLRMQVNRLEQRVRIERNDRNGRRY